MKLSSLLLLLVLVMVAAFAALNWGVFLSPTELSLVYTTIHMPLGLVMLGLLVFVAAVFLVFIAYLQTSALFEARRHARELQANRDLAERAEASRYTELRAFLEAELAKQSSLNAESRAVVLGRIDQLERDVRAFTEQAGNTLAAYIGELEDRLEKMPAPPAIR